MAQIAKLELQIDIKSAADKFYEIFRSQLYLIPKICPEKIKNIKVIHGDWKTVGSVRQWTYNMGSTLGVKEKVEAVDDRNKSITFRVLDGEILNAYKSIRSTVQATPKTNGSSVKWTLEYEKLNEGVPVPSNYMEFAASVSKDIDAYLFRA